MIEAFYRKPYTNRTASFTIIIRAVHYDDPRTKIIYCGGHFVSNKAHELHARRPRAAMHYGIFSDPHDLSASGVHYRYTCRYIGK